MAYPITLESKLWSDPRFSKLQILIGSRRLAIGEVVDAWLLAQQCALEGLEVIPYDEWMKHGFSDALFESGMAEKHETGVYVSGSRERNAWLERRSEQRRKAGLKSAEVRRLRTGTAQPAPKQPEQARTTPNGSFDNPRTENVDNLGIPCGKPIQQTPNDPEQDRTARSENPERHRRTLLSTHYALQKNISKSDQPRTEPWWVERATGIWQETINAQALKRDARLEKQQIYRLVNQLVDKLGTELGIETAFLALEGARHEKGFNGLAASKFVTVQRILNDLNSSNGKGLVAKLVSYANENRERISRESVQQEPEEPASPEQIASVFEAMKGLGAAQ